jgi:hypothetical protein
MDRMRRVLFLLAAVTFSLSCGSDDPDPVPAGVSIVTEPSASAQNTIALMDQPVVQLGDEEGDPVAKAGIPVSVSIVSGGGVLGGTATVETDDDGQAVFTGLAITGTTGPRQLRFASGSLTPATSSTITLTPGPASALAFATEPSATTVNGGVLAQQPVARLADASGNAVAEGGRLVTAAVALGGGSLGGTVGVVTDASGAASFTDLAISGPVGAHTLQFSVTTLPVLTSAPIMLSAGPLARVLLIIQPADTARSGIVLSRQPVAQLADAGGNPVTQAGVAITAAVATGGAGIAGTTGVVTDANGQAIFTGLSLAGEGPQRLVFSAAGVGADTSAIVQLPVALANGVGVGALTGAISSARWYTIVLPPDQGTLVVSTTGGAGNADLYVGAGHLPSPATSSCAGTREANTETCFFGAPAAGPWYILLMGGDNYADLTLRASYDSVGGCTLASPGDVDEDRLPDCMESGSHVAAGPTSPGTDANDPDTDDDGLSDGDEVLGTVGGLDLPALGVSALHKDILLEYDWFEDALDGGECGPHSHRPTVGAVGKVTAAFAGAPVANPDGLPGIHVIHDYGQGGAFIGGNFISDPDGVLASGVDGGDFNAYKLTNFAGARSGYFHYVILPHRYFLTSASSGQAELPGNDLIVSLYCYGTDQNVANTLMHELGHNLLLQHGGNTGENYKPNYNSVMNYRYQFPGIDGNCDVIGDGILSYSTGGRSTLNEQSLSEPTGICAGTGPSIDWSGDGDTFDFGVVADVNAYAGGTGNGIVGFVGDYSDWSNLLLTSVTLTADGAMLAPHPRQIITCPEVPRAFQLVPGR